MAVKNLIEGADDWPHDLLWEYDRLPDDDNDNWYDESKFETSEFGDGKNGGAMNVVPACHAFGKGINLFDKDDLAQEKFLRKWSFRKNLEKIIKEM